MKKAAWLSDIHLDFVFDKDLSELINEISQSNVDFVFISGDISNGNNIEKHLCYLHNNINVPIYFVLGNHDYYMGRSISSVQNIVRMICNEQLYWLPDHLNIELTKNTCLLGHGAWGDCQYGNWLNTGVRLADFRLIRELRNCTKDQRIKKLQNLGKESAYILNRNLKASVDYYKNIIILTHVPPFIEAARYEGKISHVDFLPFFACKSTGDVIKKYALEHKHVNFTVLCGHTHDHANVQILNNLNVKAASVEYGQPNIQEVIIIE